ncbi:MAG TPA: substrate-binding domain-containing protein [Terriglobales bacterium]|nr:substrate-binding domain-containing protein [Terriglobales bacterium]
MRTCRIAAFALLVASWTAVAAAKDIALISNKENHVDGVSLPDLVKICKGQTNHWQDGKPVTLVIRDPGSPEMKLVLQKIYEMPKEDVSSLITAANHNRQNHPAVIIVDSDEAVVKKVESAPGAVGLVDVYAITGGVTVVRVDNKLPLQPGYVLHGN